MVISSKGSEPRAGARVGQGQRKEGQGGEKENGVAHGISLVDEGYASPVPEFLVAIAGAKGASDAAAVCIVQPTLPKNCILHGGRLAPGRQPTGCHCIPRSQMARQLHRMKLHPPRAQQW
jgi:hypothetical protein